MFFTEKAVVSGGNSFQKEVTKYRFVKEPDENTTCLFHFLRYALLAEWIGVLLLGCGPVPDPTGWEVDSSAYPEGTLKAYSDSEKVMGRLQNLNPHQQVDSLVFMTLLLQSYDEFAALEYAQKAYDISLEKDWDVARAISAYYVAVLKMEKGLFGEGIEDALVDAKISLRLFNRINNSFWEIRVNSLIGSLYFNQSKLDSAEKYNYLALTQIENSKIKGQEIQNIKGEIFHQLGTNFLNSDAEKGLAYFHLADSIYQLSKRMVKYFGKNLEKFNKNITLNFLKTNIWQNFI